MSLEAEGGSSPSLGNPQEVLEEAPRVLAPPGCRRQGCVAGPDHTRRSQDGNNETLFSLDREESSACLFSVLSLAQRLFCLSSVSGDKMT